MSKHRTPHGSKLKQLKELQFIQEIASGKKPREAVFKIADIGKSMEHPTPEKLMESAKKTAQYYMKTMSEEGKAMLAQLTSKAINKIESKMEATKGVYFMGGKIADEEDHSTQLAAAKTILEYAGMKPAEKKSIEVRTFFDAVVDVVEGDVEDVEVTIPTDDEDDTTH